MSKDEFQIWNRYKDIALLKKEQLEREFYGFWTWIWLKVCKVEMQYNLQKSRNKIVLSLEKIYIVIVHWSSLDKTLDKTF